MKGPSKTEKFGEVVLYRTKDGTISVEVRLHGDTVWLTQAQMVELFQRNQSVLSRHIRKIFKEGELDPKSNMQKMHSAKSDKPVVFYNLDVIISVGYRVNSKRGTQFRIWATRTLKNHLIQGYTLNERRLQERGIEMEQAVQLLSRTLTRSQLVGEQGRAVLEVITRYAKSWRLLKEFDEGTVQVPEKKHPTQTSLNDRSVGEAIAALKKELLSRGQATDLFGRERGKALAGLLGAIEQTFGGQSLYPSIEEKAAHLLYFIIKDHPFTDGNKRIGSFLFVLFLRENGYLNDSAGRTRFNDNALVALALLIAESDPAQKELMVRLIMNLLTEEAP